MGVAELQIPHVRGMICISPTAPSVETERAFRSALQQRMTAV